MLNGVYRVVVLWFWMVRPHRATDSIETKGILCVLLRILCLFRHSSLSGNKRNGGRDVNGNRGFAATEMKLYGTIIISYDHTDFTSNRFAGAGIYVTGSGDVFSTAVVNNTVIRLACATCPLNFSCYTNESSSATIVFPNGISRSSYNSREQHISSLPDSGINLRYSYYLYSTVNPPSGVYTCRFVRYGTGRVTEVSIGVNFDYNTSKSILTPWSEDNSHMYSD